MGTVSLARKLPTKTLQSLSEIFSHSGIRKQETDSHASNRSGWRRCFGSRRVEAGHSIRSRGRIACHEAERSRTHYVLDLHDRNLWHVKKRCHPDLYWKRARRIRFLSPVRLPTFAVTTDLGDVR